MGCIIFITISKITETGIFNSLLLPFNLSFCRKAKPFDFSRCRASKKKPLKATRFRTEFFSFLFSAKFAVTVLLFYHQLAAALYVYATKNCYPH